MTVETMTANYDAFLRDWEELYNAGAHTFARHEMREATEAFPDHAELWFLRGQSELAARDVYAAKESFEKALEILTDPKKARSLSGTRWSAVEKCLEPVLDGLKLRILADGPPTPWAWLSDPDSVRSRNPALVGRVDKPLGRTTPLMPLTPTPRHEHPTGITKGVLGEHLVRIELRHDTMKSLLGRDANIKVDVNYEKLIDPDLKIERGQIVIMDSSVVLEKPKLPEIVVHGEAQAKVQPELPQVRIERTAARPSVVPRAPTTAREHSAPRKPPRAPERPAKPAKRKSATEVPKPNAGKTSASETWEEWEKRMEALVAGGAAAAALAQIDEAIGRYPASSRLQEVKARVMQLQGDGEAAASQWIQTYRKAVEAGSDERADRAFRQAKELASENGDLLMDLAGLAFSVGSPAMALAAGKLAVDVYRRRNDREKLADALHKLYEWAPNEDIRRELDRIAGSVAGRAREIAETAKASWPKRPAAEPRIPDLPRSGTGAAAGYGKVAPPPLKRSPPLTEDERRKRAMEMEWSSPGTAKPEAGKKEEESGPDAGLFLMIGSVLVLLFSFAGSMLPGIFGLIVSHGYLNHARKTRPSESHATATIAKGICIGAIVLGLLL